MSSQTTSYKMEWRSTIYALSKKNMYLPEQIISIIHKAALSQLDSL